MNLSKSTAVTPTQIAGRLITYSKCSGPIHEQQAGAPIGRPVCAVIADLCMQVFEEQAIETTLEHPKIGKRYADDSYLLHRLNHQHPSIRFTMETHIDNMIAFLDSLVRRNQPADYTPTSNLRMIHSTHNQPCCYNRISDSKWVKPVLSKLRIMGDSRVRFQNIAQV